MMNKKGVLKSIFFFCVVRFKYFKSVYIIKVVSGLKNWMLEGLKNMFEMKAGYVQKIKKNKRGSDTVYIENEAGEVVAKRCNMCKELKGLVCFSVGRTNFAGKLPNCKECSQKHKKQYDKKTKKQKTEYSKQYYLKNKELDNKRSAEWRKNNKERKAELNKLYLHEKPEVFRYHTQKRIALKHSLPSTLTIEQDALLLEIQKGKCFLSGASEGLHLEHFIPISWGAGGTTFENCYYMEGSLNNSKYNKNPFEWIKEQPEEYQQRFHEVLIPELAKRNGLTVEEFTAYVNKSHENYINQTEEVGA
jgi:hypothetical protein